MKIFVFNPGSSSLKFGLYDVGADEAVLMSGVVERIGTPQARLRVTYPQQAEQPLAAHSLKQAAQAVFYALDSLLGQNVAGDAFACRVVHGGSDFFTPTVMTPETLHALSALDDLAPLHNRAAIDVMETVRQISPDVPLVAVFDTAFHQTLPEVAYTYALPAEFAARHGLRRYGFQSVC
jgi:acetate kinase